MRFEERAMRVTVLAIGYQGDVGPLVTLAAGLRKVGHHVRVAAHDDFEDLVQRAGVPRHQLTGQISSFLGGAAGAALRDRIQNPERYGRFVEGYLNLFLPKLYDEVWEACQDSEVVLGWSWTRMLPSLAERLAIPCFVVSPMPVPHLPTRAFSYPFQSDDSTAGEASTFGRGPWSIGRAVYAGFAQGVIDNWRERTLGLPCQSWRAEYRVLQRLPHLLVYSQAVLPRPRDWPPWVHVTGYQPSGAPSGYVPPRELERFLDEGPPPVAIGFSSQVARNPKQLTATVLEAIRLSERRALLLSGWGGLRTDRLPPEILHVPSVPHDWLFPRVAAVVHHGGAGTVAAALRAGVPSVAVPFGYDQAFWGRQLETLGVGPGPLPASTLTADALAMAINRLVSDEELRRCAHRFAGILQAEDGVSNAIAVIESYLEGWKKHERPSH